MLDVRMKDESGSEGMDVRGRELIMALVSAGKVVRTSWVIPWAECSFIILFSIRLVSPIIRSHTPSICEEWGEVNTQTVTPESENPWPGIRILNISCINLQRVNSPNKAGSSFRMILLSLSYYGSEMFQGMDERRCRHPLGDLDMDGASN